MQQLTFVKKGILEWQEVPEPVLQAGTDAIVRPLAVARCDLDIAILNGLTPFRGPFPFGHEFVGEIVDIGEDVRGFKIGQKVVVPFQISCGSCDRCHYGLTHVCHTYSELPGGTAAYGLGRDSRQWGGALSDLVRVPEADHMLVDLPDSIDYKTVASASDNLSDAWRTVGPFLKENPAQSVLIVGGGAFSIGIYAVAIAQAIGAPKITYLDTDEERLELAQSAGAIAVEGDFTTDTELHMITVDASGREDGLRYAIKTTEPGGICTSVGIYWQDVALPFMDMYLKGITFKTGIVDSRTTIPEVLSLVEAGTLKPERFTTHLAEWADAPEALFLNTTKVIVAR